MTTCYRDGVNDSQQQQVEQAQTRVEAAEKELEAAIVARNGLFRALHSRGVMATEMARATRTERYPQGLHRTVIQRIVTPPGGTG